MTARGIRPEWRNFTVERQDFLKKLSTEKDCSDLMPWLIMANSGRDFLTACLTACAELKPWDADRFRRVMAQVETQAEGDRDVMASKMDKRAFWTKAFQALFTLAIDTENADMLEDLLIFAHDDSRSKLGSGRPRPNNPSLLLACEKDNYDLVHLMVSYGYRLRLSDLSSDSKRGRIARGETTWRDYMEVPLPGDKEEEVDRPDDLEYLHHLRMMSAPSYIFACYMVVADKKDLASNERPVCECWANEEDLAKGPKKGGRWPRIRSPRRTRLGLIEMMRFETLDDVFHYCPATSKFRPHPDCYYHVECNDPIYRCFDLARLASQACKHLPQYREEIGEIGRRCRRLSAEILGMCKCKADVAAVVEEQSGSAKYFREHTKLINCPRMRLAVEANHKDFVSHVNAQQYLSERWYGDTGWQGRLFLYKTLYFFLQVILTPIHISVALFLTAGRRIKLHNRNQLPSLHQDHSWPKRLFLKYLHLCDEASFNMELPMNRFISLLGFYLIFMMITIVAVMKPLYPDTHSTELKWYHLYLLVYSCSVLLGYGMQRMELHISLYDFFTFWRFSSVTMHISIIISIILMFLTNVFLPCYDDMENFIFLCPGDYLDLKRKLSGAIVFFFSAAVAHAVLRLNFYLQLHPIFGPIIISLAKVFMDVYTMMIEYALMLVAFTFAFVILLTSDYYVDDEWSGALDNKTMIVQILLNETGVQYDPENHDGNLVGSFKYLLISLFWSILDPGPYVESAFLSKKAEFRYFIFTVGSAFFQIVTAVVMLNLLIAIMNASVQKVQERRDLYWKFTRAGIWMEFFDDRTMLPPPFTIFNLVFLFVHLGCSLAKRLGWWFDDEDSVVENGHEHRRRMRRTLSTGACKVNKVATAKRLNHARVMVRLVERVLKKRTEKNADTSKMRVVLQEVEEMLKKLKRREEAI